MPDLRYFELDKLVMWIINYRKGKDNSNVHQKLRF